MGVSVSKKSTSATSSGPGSNRVLIIGGIVAAAVLVALVFIILSSNSISEIGKANFEGLTQERLPDGGFVIGDPNAPITIIEFADYACPHCQEYEPTIARIVNEYVRSGKARLEFRIFPTAGGATTVYVGNVLVCMEEQKPGLFWEAHNLLFQNAAAGNYSDATMRQLAADLGVDYAQALACSQEQDQVATDVAFGQSLGVSGTPAIRARYADGVATSLVVDGVAQDRGGPSAAMLIAAIEAAQ
ncbi:MAG: DsbA family protein [Anaerolineae bacterium]|nr:DsbA family protein [Anaerolineae bacterium]